MSAASARHDVLTRSVRSRTDPQSIEAERRSSTPIRKLADLIIDTSKFTVHELRDIVKERFRSDQEEVEDHGVRDEFRLPATACRRTSDLVFDVRFLPNPNYIPDLSPDRTNPASPNISRSFPADMEFIERISDLLEYLLPHYIQEGKSYLTIRSGVPAGSTVGDDGR